MDDQSIRDIYSNMIAGRLPCGSASATKVVTYQSQVILGTDRIHALIVERDGFLYFFAIESRFLASTPEFKVPFADVLPGEAGHLGDGIYTLRYSDFSVAMIIERGNLSVMCNDHEVLDDFLLGFDLPIYSGESLTGKPLKSLPQLILGVSEKASQFIFKASLFTLAICLAIFASLQVAEVYHASKDQGVSAATAIEMNLNSTISQLSVQQPLARQISRVQQVSATVIRAGGWIQNYSLNDKNQEVFEVVLPSWVSQDYLDSLGRDVVTDLRDAEGLLTVRKLAKEKKK